MRCACIFFGYIPLNQYGHMLTLVQKEGQMKNLHNLVRSASFVFVFNIFISHAEYFGPSFLGYSPFAPSNTTGEENIALHKAVLSGAIEYTGPGNTNAYNTEHPEKAFDGDINSSTGSAGNITVDLGDVYLVDSLVLYFSDTPPRHYEVSRSLYLGSKVFLPTYNLTTGLGAIPIEETVNQEYRSMMLITSVKKVDKQKIPPQLCRFLNFGISMAYNGQYFKISVNEIEVYGKKYIPKSGDEKFLSRKKWITTAYADAAPAGEGQTITHAIDGNYANGWQPQTETKPGQWYQIDFGEELTFNQLNVIFEIVNTSITPKAIRFFATNDLSNWGQPIALLDYRDSTTVTFPLQKKRYIRFEQNTTSNGRWTIDDINVLAPVDPNAISIKPKSKIMLLTKNFLHSFSNFNLLGKTKRF